MSEKLEQVAKAISDAFQKRAYGRILTVWRAPEMSDTYIDERLADARAAIEALREPTEEMKAVEDIHWGYSCNTCGGLTEGWYAMIDEALK